MSATLDAGNTIAGVAGTASAISYTFNGDEISGSPKDDSFKPLAGPAFLPTSVATLYTVPSVPATQSLLSSLVLINTTGSTVTGICLYENGTTAVKQITQVFSMAGHSRAVITVDGILQVTDANGAVLGSAPLDPATPSTIDPDDPAVVGTSALAAHGDHQHAIATDPAGAIAIGDAAAEGSASSFARSDHKHSLASPAAPADVTKSAASAGAATGPARADHKHDISTAAPGTIAPDDTANEGSATSLARSDHRHAIVAATPGSILPDDVAAEGVATSFARSDHTHAITAATAGTIAPDDTAAEGAATSFARSDHRHAITTDPAGAIAVGDSAAEGAAATFARSDHRHSLAAPAAPADVTKAAASAGASSNVARADHKHDVSTAAVTTIGTANTEGTATSLARSDHVHNHGVQSDGTLHAVATSTLAGFESAADYARARREWDSYADFGIVEDLRKAEEITTSGTQQVIAASGTTVTIPNAGASTPFTSTAVDGGKRITIRGAGAGGAMYVGTIVTVTGPTTCTVTPAAGTTMTATTTVPVTVQWGTDNTAAINSMVATINAQTYPTPKIVFGKYTSADWTNAVGFPVPASFTKPVWFEGVGGNHTTDVGDYTKTGGTRLAWWGTSSDGGTNFGAFITISPPSTGASTPAYVRSFVNADAGTAGTAALGKLASSPVSPTAGNVLIATVSGGSNPTVSAVPSGWNLLLGPTTSGADNSYLYWKVAQVGEPSSWTWTLSASSPWCVSVAEYSGVSTSATPITAVATGVANPFNTPTVTTVTNGCLIAAVGISVITSSQTYSVAAACTLDSQGSSNVILGNDPSAVVLHDTTNQVSAGLTTARAITALSTAPTATVAYTIALSPASSGGQAIKRPHLSGCWIDGRNGDQNQALYGLKLASCHGAMIDDGFMVMDALAQGMWCDIATSPSEASDTTRFAFGEMCFRQLDNMPGATLTTTTVTSGSPGLVLTNATPTTLTIGSTTGYGGPSGTGSGYAWVMTTIGQVVLIRYASVSGSTLVNCIVSAEDVANAPTTVAGAFIVPCQPGLGGAMKLSGGSGHNTCCGVIKQVQVSYGTTWGQAAIDCGNSDSIDFEQVIMNGGSNANDGAINRIRRPGWRINGSNTSQTLASRNHVLRSCDPGGLSNPPGTVQGGVSAMGVLNTGTMMAFPSGPTYNELQQMGNAAPVPTVELGASFFWSGNGLFREGGLAALGANAVLATGGVVTGLAVPIPPQGWQIGTVLEYDLEVQKGAAGTSLGIGIRQNSAITAGAGTLIANAAFTGTAVADNGRVRIILSISGPLGATCAAIAEYWMTHNLVSTAGVGTGLWTGAITAGALVSATSNALSGHVNGAMTTFNSAAPASGPQFLYLDLVTGSTSVTLLAGSTVRCIKAANP